MLSDNESQQSRVLPVDSILLLRGLLSSHDRSYQRLLHLRENTPLRHAPKFLEAVVVGEEEPVAEGKGEQKTVSEEKGEQKTVAEGKGEQKTVLEENDEQKTVPEENDEQKAPWSVEKAVHQVSQGEIGEVEAAVATGATKWKWLNPEVHITKAEAFQFVAGKVELLRNFRDKLSNGGIASTDALLGLLSEDEVVSEDPPETYAPWRFNGPQLYAVIEEINTWNRDRWELKMRDALERASQAGVVRGEEIDPDYWDLNYSWARNTAAHASLKTFNHRYLSIKRQALVAMRDSINSQLPDFVAEFMTLS